MTKLLSIISALLALLVGLFFRQKSVTEQIRREAAEHAAEVQKADAEATINGMENENRIRGQYRDNNDIRRDDIT